tara:strand:+ start:228 stop:521 length:294 start_codon:yes stop_codon:yes gene_type:complete
MHKIVDGKKIEMTAEEITAFNSYTETNEQKLEKIKNLRLNILTETDWWVLRGNMTDAQSTYRQKLRDIPADYDSSKYDELLARDASGNLTHSVWSKP